MPGAGGQGAGGGGGGKGERAWFMDSMHPPGRGGSDPEIQRDGIQPRVPKLVSSRNTLLLTIFFKHTGSHIHKADDMGLLKSCGAEAEPSGTPTEEGHS